MKLVRMNCVQSIDHFPVVGANVFRNQSWFGSESNGLKIPIIRADIESSDHPQRCESCSTARYGSKAAFARFATKNSLITMTSSQTTRIRKEWAALGGTIIRTISKQSIGGATKRRDQPE